MSIKRGAFIVFEGCDRSGKTTHCRRIVQALNENMCCFTDYYRFPERSTAIGKTIDQYLRNNEALEDHAIHLLFSANRWEKLSSILNSLHNGRNVIVDRYAYSGVAFSAAKTSLSVDWCKQSDRGLPEPDLVIYLNVSLSEAKKRGQYGAERYENDSFQSKVKDIYNILRTKDNKWRTIDTDNKSLDQIFSEILSIVEEVISQPKDSTLATLWRSENL